MMEVASCNMIAPSQNNPQSGSQIPISTTPLQATHYSRHPRLLLTLIHTGGKTNMPHGDTNPGLNLFCLCCIRPPGSATSDIILITVSLRIQARWSDCCRRSITSNIYRRDGSSIYRLHNDGNIAFRWCMRNVLSGSVNAET